MNERRAIAVMVTCSVLIIAVASASRAPKAGPRTGQNTPSFHAKGTHMCQSKTSIGHECVVEGDFNDCDEAYHKLKMQDCCSTTKEGGASSGFTLNSCVPH